MRGNIFDLMGKVIVVTGGAQGLGLAMGRFGVELTWSSWTLI